MNPPEKTLGQLGDAIAKTIDNPGSPAAPFKPSKPLPAGQEERGTINVDGTKLAAFVGAVQQMTDTLRRLNIEGIMEAFVVGSTHEAIDYAIDQGKRWQGLSSALTKYTQETSQNLTLLNTGIKTHMSHMKQLFEFLDDPRTKRSMDTMHDMYRITHALAVQKRELLIIIRTMVDEYDKEAAKK